MTHKEKLLQILQDGNPHSNFEIHEKTGMLRYSARILDLKNSGFLIEGWKDEKDSQKYWYQLKAGSGHIERMAVSEDREARLCEPPQLKVFNQELFNFNRPSAGHWDY